MRNDCGRALTSAACAALTFLGAAAWGQPPESDARQIVERLLTADKRPPALYDPDPAQPHPPERVFQFDDLLALTAADILQAVEFTLAKYPAPLAPEAQAGYARALNEKLQALFEYYPVIARSEDDLQLLLNIMLSGTSAPRLREFLIRQTAPGIGPESAFRAYLTAMLPGSDSRFDDQLSEIIQNPTEYPAVQVAAVEALGGRLAGTYAAWLASDPEVRKSATTGEPGPHIRMLAESPGTIPLARRTEVLIERKSEWAGRVAAMLLGVARDAGREPALRKAAEKVAAEMLRDYPLPNREALRPPAAGTAQ